MGETSWLNQVYSCILHTYHWIAMHYYVLLCITMYYYVLLCITICITMYYYVLLCITMYYYCAITGCYISGKISNSNAHTLTLTHTLTHSLTHTLTHSLTHTHTHSLTHSLTHTAEVVSEAPITEATGVHTLDLPATMSAQCQLLLSPSDVSMPYDSLAGKTLSLSGSGQRD